MTTVLLALVALAAAGFAIAWLTRVNKLVSDLGHRVLESQDIGRINDAAAKTETFESRMAGCEHKAAEGQKQLAEFKTKLSELATKLGSVEQTANKNEAGFAELVPDVKALADEVQAVRKFQAATEKVHSVVLAALSEMQASLPTGEDLAATLGAKPKEASEGPQDWWQKEVEDQKASGPRPWQSS
jgi:septal ring factor EnvC (AmiA/AmiB activator)